MAFGVASARAVEAVRLEDAGVTTGAADCVSGVAVTLDSVVVGGVATSGLGGALGASKGLTFSPVGLASCDEMIAGSTGAPLTVDCPVGALLAGGVYLLPSLDDNNGGKSCCLRTPLYL